MKKRLGIVLCLVLAITTLLSTAAFAASEPAPGPAVRVNGELVDFPDAKPFIDENSRTLIPVRFVSEQLGAKVSWDGKSQTAAIEKDGTRIDITIGKKDLKVTKHGKSETVTMDTAALLKEGRTYVPIRFVAEALGAYVDYSGRFGTVGIYMDELTAEQIKKLQAYPYTQPQYAVGYEEGKARYNEDTLKFLYGDRSGFGTYANAREYLYHEMDRGLSYSFPKLGKTLTGGTNDAFFKTVVDEAAAEINYSSKRMTVTFHADESCIYQADAMDRTTAVVRGIAEVRLHVKPTELEGAETALLCKLGFTQLYKDKDMFMDIDVHMNTQSSYNVNIHTIVPLGEAY